MIRAPSEHCIVHRYVTFLTIIQNDEKTKTDSLRVTWRAFANLAMLKVQVRDFVSEKFGFRLIIVMMRPMIMNEL